MNFVCASVSSRTRFTTIGLASISPVAFISLVAESFRDRLKIVTLSDRETCFHPSSFAISAESPGLESATAVKAMPMVKRRVAEIMRRSRRPGTNSADATCNRAEKPFCMVGYKKAPASGHDAMPFAFELRAHRFQTAGIFRVEFATGFQRAPIRSDL